MSKPIELYAAAYTNASANYPVLTVEPDENIVLVRAQLNIWDASDAPCSAAKFCALRLRAAGQGALAVGSVPWLGIVYGDAVNSSATVLVDGPIVIESGGHLFVTAWTTGGGTQSSASVAYYREPVDREAVRSIPQPAEPLSWPKFSIPGVKF